MVFGSWNVDENGIAWQDSSSRRFIIPLDKLNVTKPDVESGELFYDWIITATEQDWLTQNDLYDLNYAFVFAIAKSGLEFDYDIFDATLAYQFEAFDAEDSQDLDL